MVTKTKKDGIKLVGLEVQNLYKIDLAELEFSPEGGVIEITGLNKSGKTSLLKSFMALVGGGKAIDSDPRNDEGKEDGASSRVFGRFSNGFQITRRPTLSNPKGNLVIEGPDGGKYKQGDVDPWIGNSAFDLHALKAYATRPEKLVPLLLSIAPDPELPQKLKDIQADRQATERERSPWHSAKQRAERTRRPEGDRPEAVDVSATVDALRQLRDVAEQRAELARTAVHMDALANGIEGDIETAQEAIAATEDRIEVMEEQIKALHGNIEAMRDGRKLKLEGIKTAEAEREAIPDPASEIAAGEARLAEADEINETLEPWREWDRAQAETEEARVRISGYNDDLAHLKKLERKLLTENCPDVPGLSFADDGLPLLHEKTMDKASGREWVEFTAAIAFAEDPDLRVALIDEAEGVDQEGMEALHKLSKEKDFQVLVCRIHATGVGEVVVCEDGRAWKVEAGK